MNTFDFVSVLLSIVVSLAFTHLLAGVARLIAAEGVKFSLTWAGWVGVLLFSCVDYWFSLWQARKTHVWTLGLVALWLLLAAALYLTVRLAVPEFDVDDGKDLVAFNARNRRKYLAAFAVTNVVGALVNLTVEAFRTVVPTLAIYLMIGAVAWIWPGRRAQFAALAAQYAMTIWYALNYIPQL